MENQNLIRGTNHDYKRTRKISAEQMSTTGEHKIRPLNKSPLQKEQENYHQRKNVNYKENINQAAEQIKNI
jgi:hypothetical protein